MVFSRKWRSMTEPPPLRAAQIDAILPFLSAFESKDFQFGEWKMPEGQLPWLDFSERARAFVEALNRNDWIVPFDWGVWQEEAAQFVESPQMLESAGAETIRKLLTL